MAFLEAFKRFWRPVPETSFIAAQGRMRDNVVPMAQGNVQIINGHHIAEFAATGISRCGLCGASLEACRNGELCDLRARS